MEREEGEGERREGWGGVAGVKVTDDKFQANWSLNSDTDSTIQQRGCVKSSASVHASDVQLCPMLLRFSCCWRWLASDTTVEMKRQPKTKGELDACYAPPLRQMLSQKKMNKRCAFFKQAWATSRSFPSSNDHTTPIPLCTSRALEKI